MTNKSAMTQESADALFVAGDWQAATAAFRALLDADPENAGNWFNLASSLHQLEDFEGARDAYLKALEAGYQPLPRVRYRLARVHMSLGDEEAALVQLEEIAKTGGPSGAVVAGTTEFAPLLDNPRFLAVVEALTPCTDEIYRHFDFWLGEWDVSVPGASGPHASSRISSREGGCVVLEEYTTNTGFTGMSINFYDNVTKVWHQTWMSNAGGSVYLEGGLTKDGAMQLTDKDLPIAKISGTINKVTWSSNEDGSVRQFWEASTDEGKTWSVAFDGRYTPKED